ncbi:MBL fold metallo-hydrolase [Persephonella sp.]|uniref:MBL fold metallo-hydrolase n=1 Tax=Persephonella sp. TaxID=2060922 RepID=UPI0025E99B2B|nr:MBL fold metallo-hydrolase [Persephonella sp.]
MIKILTVGPLQENTIFIIDEDTKEVVVVDPGAEGERISRELENYNLRYILATHGHIDHVGQVGFLKKNLDVPFFMSKKDLFLINNDIFPGFAQLVGATPCPEPDRFLKEGDIISFGRFNLRVIETPGHTPGSVCFYDQENGFVITGDTLFKGSIGRTDLPGGDMKQMENSLKKLMELPDDTDVIPGHGDPTKVGIEKKTNPYITGNFRIELW